VSGAAPYEGVRVIELSQWVFAPVAGALLADWGADVIRVERETGDPYGGLATQGIGRDSRGGVNLSLALVNRGKRSIVLDLRHEQGRAILEELLQTADVFLTNFRLSALARLELDADTLLARHPGLVYARGLAYGARGPDADRSGYDSAAFWSRGGFAHVVTPPDAEYPIPQRGAIGDRNAGMALAFGIASALIKRGRTGEGSVVDVSLLATAMWTLSSDVLSALQGMKPAALPRRVNPVFGTYETKDGRFIQLTFLESDRYWADLCRALQRPELVEDDRFVDHHARDVNRDACIAELEDAFGRRTFDECKDLLSDLDAPWAPVQAVEEVLEDPQVLANEYLGEVTVDGGPSYTLPNVPLQFDERPPPLRRAPEVGEHTEEILLELGHTWDEITALSEMGATL